MTSISREEAITALAATVEPGDSNSYYVTSEPGEELDGEPATVYMVGYAAADPEESDPEGDPTVFVRLPGGAVAMQGPSF